MTNEEGVWQSEGLSLFTYDEQDGRKKFCLNHGDHGELVLTPSQLTRLIVLLQKAHRESSSVLARKK